MKVTRILEKLGDTEVHGSISQGQLVTLLAKHKALLLQNDDDANPLTVEDFADFF